MIIIKIDTSNDSFLEDFGFEVAQILNRLANEYMNDLKPNHSLSDIKGNTCGLVETKDEEEN